MIDNRYELHEELGQGAMGAVYRATDRLSGQPVALKRLRLDPTRLMAGAQWTVDDLQVALAREFQTLASLRHPNIISVLDFGFEAPQQPYFTMTLLQDAQPIIAYAEGRPLVERVRLIIELLEALNYLHRCGILHRDLKGSNVLVAGGQVRVLDFGLAMPVAQAQGVQGTITHMSPETLRGEAVHHSADLYAVGVLAYHILTGAPLYDTAQPLASLFDQILNEAPDLLRIPELEPPRRDPNLIVLDFDGGGTLATIIGRLLEKDPADRYQDAERVIADLYAAMGEPAPAESTAVRESLLQAALDAAQRGRGSLWLLGGEIGVGKSRLAEEVRVRALVAGALVLRGQAVEGGGLPYQVWRSPLRRLVLNTPLTELEAAVLKAVVPDIGALLGREVPDPPALSGAAAQERLVLTIVDVFRRQTRPVVLLAEDLQWAVESLVPLRYLLPVINELPLLVVGDYRNDERPDLPASLPGARLLPLGRLDRTAIEALAGAMLGDIAGRQGVVELLERETEGNVYFLVETVRVLAESAGRLSQVGAGELPTAVMAGGVQAVVRRRLRRVVDHADLLAVAAVAGRELDLRVLEVAWNTTPARIERFLLTAVNAAVLDIRDGRWRFAHDRLRDQVVRDQDEVATLHRRVATAIETVYAAPSERRERALVLAQHWERAGDGAAAGRYYALEGDRTAAIGAGAESREHFERALALLPPEQISFELRLNHVRAVRRAGDIGAMVRLLRELEPLAPTVIELAGVKRRRATALISQGEAVAAHAVLEELATLGDDPDLLLHLHQGWASVLAFQGHNAEALTHLEQALELTDDEALRMDIEVDMSIVLVNLGRLDEGRVLKERVLVWARERGDRGLEAEVMNGLGVIAGMSGDHETSRRHYEQAYAMSMALRKEAAAAVTAVNLGIANKNLGDYAAAREWYERSLATMEAINYTSGLMSTHGNLGALLRLMGDYEGAARSLQTALRLSLQMDSTMVFGHIALEMARLAHLRGQLARAVELAALVQSSPVVLPFFVPPAEELLQQLETELPAAAFEAAAARGRGADIHAAMRDLLDEP